MAKRARRPRVWGLGLYIHNNTSDYQQAFRPAITDFIYQYSPIHIPSYKYTILLISHILNLPIAIRLLLGHTHITEGKTGARMPAGWTQGLASLLQLVFFFFCLFFSPTGRNTLHRRAGSCNCLAPIAELGAKAVLL